MRRTSGGSPGNVGARPRVRAPDRRRDELLAAAIDLFLTQGIEATSVADIAHAAGVAKGTFYLYFKTREDLLDALRAQLADAAVKGLARRPPPSSREGWSAYLDALTDDTISFFTEQAALHGLVAGRSHEHAPDRGEGPGIHELLGMLTETIALGVEMQALSIVDAAIAAALLLDLLHSAVHQALAAPDDSERVREVARGMVRGSLLSRTG
jgi:AcrR family transcriptional regulator